MQRGVFGVLLCILIIPSTSLYVYSQNNLLPGLNQMDFEIPVDIKLWGFNNTDQIVREYLTSSLTTQIIQASNYPLQGKEDQWQVQLNEQYYGLVNTINFSFSTATDDEYSKLLTAVTSTATALTRVNSPDGSGQEITGLAIDSFQLQAQLDSENFDETSRYVIHVLNFNGLNKQINENSTHWIQIGKTKIINSALQDMRNLMIIDQKSIAFDSTAIAPYFGITNTFSNFTTDKALSYLTTSLNEVVNTIIVGNSASYNFLALEDDIHVAKVFLSNDKEDEWYRRYKNTLSSSFKDQVSKLLPYFKIKQKVQNVDLDDFPRISNFFDDNVVKDGKISNYYITKSFAEEYKRLLRSDVYNEWPPRYFYSINFFFGNNTRFLINTTNGFDKYSVGHLGFSIMDLNEIYLKSPFEISSNEILATQFYLFGKTMGLEELDSPFISQFESVMSSYGVSNQWNVKFTQFEIDQIARRYAVMYKYLIQDSIISERSKLEKTSFFWINTDRFDTAISFIELGDKEISKLNYTGAVENYILAYDVFQEGLDKITYSKNFVNNGFYLLIFSLILGYYIKLLKESSITKEELKQRLRIKRSEKMIQ